VSTSQIRHEGRNTTVAFAELLRVFGEPAEYRKLNGLPPLSADYESTEDVTQEGAKIGAKTKRPYATSAEKVIRHTATAAEAVAQPSVGISADLVAFVREQLAKAEARADKAEAALAAERERADNERAQLMAEVAEANRTVRLLMAPAE
jgi:hypothetical protein